MASLSYRLYFPLSTNYIKVFSSFWLLWCLLPCSGTWLQQNFKYPCLDEQSSPEQPKNSNIEDEKQRRPSMHYQRGFTRLSVRRSTMLTPVPCVGNPTAPAAGWKVDTGILMSQKLAPASQTKAAVGNKETLPHTRWEAKTDT